MRGLTLAACLVAAVAIACTDHTITPLLRPDGGIPPARDLAALPDEHTPRDAWPVL